MCLPHQTHPDTAANTPRFGTCIVPAYSLYISLSHFNPLQIQSRILFASSKSLQISSIDFHAIHIFGLPSIVPGRNSDQSQSTVLFEADARLMCDPRAGHMSKGSLNLRHQSHAPSASASAYSSNSRGESRGPKIIQPRHKPSGYMQARLG